VAIIPTTGVALTANAATIDFCIPYSGLHYPRRHFASGCWRWPTNLDPKAALHAARRVIRFPAASSKCCQPTKKNN